MKTTGVNLSFLSLAFAIAIVTFGCSNHAGGTLPAVAPALQPASQEVEARPFLASTAASPVRVAKIVWGAVPSAVAGTAFPVAYPRKIKVYAKTAAGKVIKGVYANPIRLRNSDKSGATQLQINFANAGPTNLLRKSTDVVQITYTGLAIAPATFSATAKGVRESKTRFAPKLQPIVFSGPQYGANIYVSHTITQELFTAKEVGWTNAPYNKQLRVSGPSCVSIVKPYSYGEPKLHDEFVVYPGSKFGTCNVTLTDFEHGQTLDVATSNNPDYTLWIGGLGSAQNGKPPTLVQSPAGCVFYSYCGGCSQSCEFTVGGGYFDPDGIAFNSAGTAYVIDAGDSNVFVIPSGCTSASCTTQIGFGSDYGTGIAVDASDNVFFTVQGGLYEIPAGCTLSSCLQTIIPEGTGAFLMGVAVAPGNNLYLIDFNSGLYEIAENGCASLSCATAISTGIFQPTAIAVDSKNDIYIGDSAGGPITEIPSGCASSSCYMSLGGLAFVGAVTGVAVDPSGAVYVADQMSGLPINNYAPEFLEMPPGCAGISCVKSLGLAFTYPKLIAATAPAQTAP